jgi:hypothetical protein
MLLQPVRFGILLRHNQHRPTSGKVLEKSPNIKIKIGTVRAMPYGNETLD